MRGDGLAQGVGPADMAIRVILRFELDRSDPGRRALHGPDLGLALPQVTPIRISVGEAQFHRLGHDVDHSHVGYGADGGTCRGPFGVHAFVSFRGQ